MARRVNKTRKKKKTYFKNYDLYSDANPKDTVRIRYTSKQDVNDTIKKLERMYKKGRITHARNMQIVNVMTQRLKVIKKRNPKIDKGRYSTSKKYFEKLKKRTKSRKKSKRRSKKRTKKSKKRTKKSKKKKKKSKRRTKKKHRVTPILTRQFRNITNVAKRSPNIINKAGKQGLRNVTNNPVNIKNLDKKAVERMKDLYELDDKFRDNAVKMYNYEPPKKIYKSPRKMYKSPRKMFRSPIKVSKPSMSVFRSPRKIYNLKHI